MEGEERQMKYQELWDKLIDHYIESKDFLTAEDRDVVEETLLNIFGPKESFDAKVDVGVSNGYSPEQQFEILEILDGVM